MSDSTSFQQTPLFQLNLLIWLSMSSTPQTITGLRPIFREEGYELQAIGQEFQVPLSVRYVLQKENIPIRTATSPDILLFNMEKSVLLPIECKVSSFSSNSENSAQANSLLTLLGVDMATTIGMPNASQWLSHLFYAVKHTDRISMSITLQELVGVLESTDIKVCKSESIGILVRNDGVYLQATQDGSLLTLLNSDQQFGVHVLQLQEGEDPRPLYILPVDPSIGISDPIELQILKERLRSAVASLIGNRLNTNQFVITEDEIMNSTIEVWDQWKDRNSRVHILRHIVRPYLKKVVSAIRHLGSIVTLEDKRMVFEDITMDHARKIRRYLTTKEFRSDEINLPNEFQLGFDFDQNN
ncbi:MAG: hypothetical protein KF726_19750 [Anaerolineae bacterium]|nr:hypothetical protein [Anaerolineae bacterium]